MATAATHSKTSRRRARSRDPQAIVLLKKDHREVDALFDQFEEAEAEREKLALVEKITLALKVHAQIEEELFYPAERGEVDDDTLDEALVEHAGMKELISQIESMRPGDELFDAKVTVLGEYVRHHVREEESQMFPQAKKSDLDLDSIGERLAERKKELMAKLGGPAKH